MQTITDSNDNVVGLKVSKRNLLALLHKLELPDSYKTLIDSSTGFELIAESDEDHYSDGKRNPGIMLASTEKFIQEYANRSLKNSSKERL